MIFFIYGTDHYRCQEKLKELKDGFIQKRDKAGLNVINLDGEKTPLDQLQQEIMMMPFLSEKKMVVIKNIFANAKKIDWPLAEFLKTRAERIDNIICFVEYFNPQKTKLSPAKKIVLGSPLFKFLTTQKFVWEFNLMNNADLANWLKKYLSDGQIKMAARAVQELIIIVGNDLNNLVLEINKLEAYKNGELIALEDVQKMVRAKFDENIFNLVDAISQKNKSTALKLTSDQLNSGAPALMILKMISRQFKILLQVKSGAGNLVLGLHPFVFRKASAQAKNFSEEKLRFLYQKLIDLESRLKTGQKNPELLFDLFIARAC